MQTRSPILLVLALTLSHITPAWAGCTSLRSDQPTLGESIAVVQGPEISPRSVEKAFALWRSCPNYGQDFPILLEGGNGTRLITIRYQPRSRTKRCGSFQGSIVTLYKTATDSSGRPVSCGPRAQTLAHELGHVLGLNDAPEDRACRSRIMAAFNPEKPWREVNPEECRAVGRKWHTPAESLP